MKLFIVIALLSVSTFSYAGVSTITCKISEEFNGKPVDVKVEFLVSNLGTAKAKLMNHPKADNDMGAIFITPEQVNGMYANMVNLNGQGGDLRVSQDRIRLFGDGDGYTFVDLVLFKNSGYQNGYVRVYGSGDQMYQDLNCSVK